jgi:hypothetical protein
VASGSLEADVNGMLTLNGGIASNVRDYESSDYWNASLNGGNNYRVTWPDARTASYLYVDNGYRSQDDLLLTGHYAGGGGIISYGYNLYSKGAVQEGVTDQGLCIQTTYDGSCSFRLGLGDRPETYQFYTTGDVKFQQNVDVSGSLDVTGTMNVTGASTMNSTLAISEAGAGTAASATGGTITLSHTTSDGTGKNSIVFKSASDSGSDYGYIEYHDDGAGGSGTQNGLLTIGVKNDNNNWNTGVTNADHIHFIVADASAALQSRANASGGNPGTKFQTNYVHYTGLYADASPIDEQWDISLTGYASGSNPDRSALYMIFNNAHDSDHDLAFTGINAGATDTVDGSAKPYGYMLRSRSNGYIAYQTEWLESPNSAKGLALGVNAIPGRYYDFAVGGKSHFGNDVLMTSDLSVNGATDLSGTLTLTGGTGIFAGDISSSVTLSAVYIGNSIEDSSNSSAIEFITDTGQSWLGFTDSSDPDSHQGLIVYYNSTGSAASHQMEFHPNRKAGSGAALRLKSVSSTEINATVDGNLRTTLNVDVSNNLTVDGSMAIGYWNSPTYATINGLLTMKMGIGSHIRDYESADYWNATLSCGNDYRSSWGNNLNSAYFYVDNGFTASADLLFTGHTSTGSGNTSRGYNLYSKGAVQDGVTDQGLCIQTEFAGTQGFHLGLGTRPEGYQFLTTGDVKFGNDVIVTGSVTESSDERLKTDIEPIDSALDKISRLRGVSYRLRKDYDASSIKHIGMIAQEMQSEFPELVETVNVDTDNDGVTEEYYGIKYSSFTAPLVEAVKELKAKNDDLATRNRALEEDNMLMKSQMQEVLARVTALENK